ncbi:MAG: VCBS repeat-containing protein, partial [Bacteroidales bacterium]|nr:VCBS repeat-containing protein [Bacteroidales bacterium]
GDTLRLSGEYMHMTTNTSGCDSVEVLSLTVNHSTDSTLEVVVLDCSLPFLLNGESYDSAGTYTQTLTNSAGCDSLLTINISVIPVALPDNIDSADCTFLPERTEWGIGDPQISSTSVLTVTTPLVGDIDDDGQQEILIPSGNYQMYVFRADGTLKSQFAISGMYAGGPVGNVAVAKVKWENDSYKNIIVVFGSNKHLYAYDANGALLWQTAQPFTSYNGEQHPLPTISFADFNHDGWTEIYVGSEIYDAATGVFLAKAEGNKGFAGRTWDVQANPYQTMAADLCGDYNLELAIGNAVYAVDIQSRTDASLNNMTVVRQVPSSLMVMEDNAAIPFTDGNTSLVDINKDGRLDVLVMNVDQSNRVVYLYVWDVETQSVICSKKISNARKFGCPQIGDIDNDGNPEICFITGTYSDHNTGDNDLIYALKYNESNPNGEMDVFWTTPHGDDSGCTGLTLFDFNQDGYAELVYRDISHLRIINGSLHHHQTDETLTQPYDLASFQCVCSTQLEYPIVVDVDLDGEAEIIVGGGNAGTWTNYGYLYIFKSAGVPWAPARKVWNQYMYNVTNVNEDLTVPQYQFNNAMAFTDPEGMVRRPFNNFLQQATTIDQYGRPFYAVSDVVVNADASLQVLGDDTVLITFSYCNSGDNTLNAPYPVTVFANSYGGDTVCTVMVNQSLPMDSCTIGEIRLPSNLLCGMQDVDNLVIVVNCDGSSIAQNGGHQPECDTTNNTVAVAIPLHTDTTYLTVATCGQYIWDGDTLTQSGEYMHVLMNAFGCDSVELLTLTIAPSLAAVITGPTTICSDSVVTLSADSAYAYLWSTGDTTRTIDVTTAGTYSLTVSGAPGCEATATHLLQMMENPITSVAIPDMCAGGSYTVSVGHQGDDNIVLGHGETTLSMADTIYLPDGVYCDPYGCSYRSPLTFTAYADGDVIQSADDIYYVLLNMEHSWIGDIYINITCPNGQKADLLKYGGSGTSDCNAQIPFSSRGWKSGSNIQVSSYLGAAYDYDVPTCDEAAFGNEPGVGWNYCWSNNTTQGYTYAPGDGYIYRSGNASSG